MAAKKYPELIFTRAHGLVLVFVLLATTAAAQQGDQKTTRDPLPIVNKAIAFHGGELYQSSETELDVCSRSGCFHLRARRHSDLFEYEVAGKAGKGERRVRWNNDQLDVWENDQLIAVDQASEQRFKDWVSARIYFPFLPYRLNDPSVIQTDLGLESWNGGKLHKVKITFETGSSTDASDEYLYWFDPQSGRVEQFAYSFEGNPGGLRFRRPRNHRRVGGLLFFDQENLGLAGDGLSVDQISPSFVEEKMSQVSVVRFEKIEVRPIP